MATWWNSSSVAEGEAGRPLLGAPVRADAPEAVAGRPSLPGRWGRLALALLLVIVPGSINLTLMVLPFLVGLGRLRGRRIPAPRGRTGTGPHHPAA